MRWEKITIQRAKNGFVIKVEFASGKESLYVLEGDEERMVETLKDIFESFDEWR